LAVVGSVEEVAAVHECGGAAAVEVDRPLGAETDDQLGEFGEGQAGVDAGAAAVADERGQLLVGDRERGARVAARR
jgi:hypothetical protein